MRNKKLKSLKKNLQASVCRVKIKLLSALLEVKDLKRQVHEYQYAKSELAELQRKLNERQRVECRTKITPLNLRNAPEDYVKWASEEIAYELTKEMAKTFVNDLATKIMEELDNVSAEEMFSPPCGTFLKVSIPVFRIDIDGLNVTEIDMNKEEK